MDDADPCAETDKRAKCLESLVDGEWDLLIVGGGITGAALAYVATHASPPLRVALVERDDLASGTSSRSSRLLHGGLRYLAQGRLGLVRALLQGRKELATLAPHLARPAPFLLPLTGRAAWKRRAGLRLYAAMARDLHHESLDRATTLAREPLLDGASLDGALTYEELATHDARLVVELAMGAAAAGAVVLPQVACDGLVRGASRVVGARVRDVLSGASLQVRAKVVVNATGPWCDGLDSNEATSARRTRLRLSRGTHIVLPPNRLPLQHTVVMFSPRDGRALFASPRDGFVLVGTTENEHHGPPETAAPTGTDVAYLLEAAQVAFPGAHLGSGDVAAAFAGVRPLAIGARGRNARGDEGDANPGEPGEPGEMDRGYLVRWDAPGLLTICGGKLTLALTGARRVLAAVSRASKDVGLPRLVAPPFSLPPLAGARPLGATLRGELERIVPRLTADRLIATYGARSGELLPLLADPSARVPLSPGCPYLTAEWHHARRFEDALSFEDFARRRGDLSLLAAVHGVGSTSPRPPLPASVAPASFRNDPLPRRAA